MQRTTFRVVCLVIAMIPLYFGTLQLVYGAGDTSAALDSQFRYLSGLYLAIGVGMAFVAWQVERATTLLAILVLAAFLGGIGRFISLSEVGMPNPKQFYGMFVELGAPLLLIWLWRIKQRSRH